MTYDNKIPTEEQWQTTYENSAKARRTTLVDNGGDNITSLNPLPVSPVSQTSDTPYKAYGTLIGTFNTEATIISYTIPTNKTLVITGLNFGGEADGKFILYIDTIPFLVFRNSAANRTQFLTINDNNFVATTGQTVEIKVTNVNYRQNAAKYETTIIGGLA